MRKKKYCSSKWYIKQRNLRGNFTSSEQIHIQRMRKRRHDHEGQKCSTQSHANIHMDSLKIELRNGAKPQAGTNFRRPEHQRRSAPLANLLKCRFQFKVTRIFRFVEMRPKATMQGGKRCLLVMIEASRKFQHELLRYVCPILGVEATNWQQSIP